jgi:outer membrane protein OmpA-like peptidoglycan-associated protein
MLGMGAAIAALAWQPVFAQDSSPVQSTSAGADSSAAPAASSSSADASVQAPSAAPGGDTAAAAPADVAPTAAAPQAPGDAGTPAAPAPSEVATASDVGASSDTANTVPGPLYQGPYAAILGRFDKADKADALGDSGGLTAAIGYRRDMVGLEARAAYSTGGKGDLMGASLNGLIFPFHRLPGLYVIGGVGVEYVNHYPDIGKVNFNITTLDGGLGYILPLRYHRYQFGLRAEALYQYGNREERSQEQAGIPFGGTDLPIESAFHDIIIHIGLQLPLGLLPPTPEVASVPVQVVPVESAPEPAPAPEPPPPPPPCQPPAPGQHISLAGCKTGDTIILHGVNFDFDKAHLTPNAKAILDEVVGALQSRKDMFVEIDGHTDGRGSVHYNQKLSEARAAAVKDYLVEHGVDAGHLSSKGFGKSRPIADNNTDEGRELNRRVELKILGGDAPAAADAVPPAAK